MVICFIFLGIFVCLYLRFRNYKREIFIKLPKKGNELKELYPVAYGIIVALDRRKISFSNIRRRKQIDSLNVVCEEKENEIIYNVRRLSLAMFVGIMAAVIGLLYSLAGREEGVLQKGSVMRPGYGQMAATYSVLANGSELDFEVSPREYSFDEVQKNFADAYEELLVIMQGENESLAYVDSDLRLITNMEKYSINISWMSSNSNVVDIYGKVMNLDFEELKTEEVVLTATMSYLDYECVNEIFVMVVAPDLSMEEKFVRDIKKLIKEANEVSLTQERLDLPKEINGEEIVYEEKREDYTVVLFAIGVVAAIAVFWGMDKDLETKIKERENQMRLDYSEIVSKLNVLIGAGMSIFKAWEKIIKDYEKKLKKSPDARRYVYEEMRISYHEILSGVSESSAYSDFGRRCNIHEYLKLGALLEQNVRKGAKGLGRMLEEESVQAFEQRKNLAKKLGEEAGTKLLVPMILMLAVVMVIVLVPAFTSFGV